MFHPFYLFLKSIGYDHPIHPMVTHIAVGLTIGAFLFGLVSLIFRQVRLKLTAWHCALVAFISVVPIAFFGFMDWQEKFISDQIQEGNGHWAASPSGHTILIKMILAGCLLVLLFASLMLGRATAEEKAGTATRAWNNPRAIGALVLYGVCFVIVVALGYFGGSLVY
jgi:uncharacterized membrane protein